MSLSSNLGSGNTALSAHSDLLDADIPTNPSSQLSFIEEIKRRGKACVLSKNYGGAEALYSKGLEVLSYAATSAGAAAAASSTNVEGGVDDSNNEEYNVQLELAILYSNRSLVRLSMSKLHESYEDATCAIQNDAGYIKGHWRLGQACIALGNNIEGLSAFEKALELEPMNKALMREVKVTKEKIEMEEKLLLAEMKIKEEKAKDDNAAAHAADDPAKDAEMEDATTPTEKDGSIKKATAKSSSKKKQQQQQPVPEGETETNTTETTTSDLFTKSDHVRGYKLRSDGTKTSYFDREISEDAKKLIGDIAPKKLDTSVSSASSPMMVEINGGNEGTSAWNTAGTWEERDVTPWAKESLTNALLAVEYILPPTSPSPGSHAVVSKVTKLDGHASYATVRGKKRYIYEFELTIKWILTLGEDHSLSCHGEMTFPDVDGTIELGEGYDIVNYSVEGSSPPGTGPLLDRFVRDGGLRDAVHNAIDDWVRLFRNTY
ncbi:hypothetical protein ACHAWU_002159 [Discostella pseudostelligera]|uniref:Activator of Hsp90 ATPase AHSA1-like N-terminal domain-containing protein n=1 Tax=Discostella pseudostelligera TaxID=259834 RepID=A0ABD3MDE5_9STRA